MENLPENSAIARFDPQEFIFKHRIPLVIVLLGLILIGVGAFFVKNGLSGSGDKVEVLNNATSSPGGEILAEVAGAVERPGVYKFSTGARVDDALVASGGLSQTADRIWVEKTINRAAKLTDGQKIYVPARQASAGVAGGSDNHSQVLSANNSTVDQSGSSTLSSQNSSLTNINTASLSQLDQLPGIGQVYGQKIIDQRPYSTIEELLSKKVLNKSTYEKIKNLISVY